MLATKLLSLVFVAMLVSPPTALGGQRDMVDAYVGCSYSDNCYPFDLQTYEVGPAIEILPEGDYPYDAVMSFDGTEVWICGGSGDGVVVIDRATNTVSHRIPVGEYLVGLCFGQDGSFALASSRDEDRIYRISTETYSVIDFIQLSNHPGNLALDPVGGRIYAVEWYGGDLYEISSDGTTLLQTVPLGNSLWQLVADPAGQRLYVTDRSSDEVRVIELASLSQETTVAVGDDPWGLDVVADGSKLVCACEDDPSVRLIDAGSWTSRVLPLESSADPRDVDILDSADLAYVCGGDNGSPDSVYVVDLIDDVVLKGFAIPGASNTNVIAVQPQMHGEAGAAPGLDELRAGSGLRLQPNPTAAGPGRLRFRLEQAGAVDLALYDVGGRRLATLAQRRYPAGEHVVEWTRPLVNDASGPVWLRLRTAAGTQTVRALRVD